MSFQKTAVAVFVSLAVFLKTVVAVVLKLTTAVAVVVSLVVFLKATVAVVLKLTTAVAVITFNLIQLKIGGNLNFFYVLEKFKYNKLEK